MDVEHFQFNCTNYTDYTESKQLPETTIKLAVSLVSFILGVTGNLTLIYLIRRTERRLSNPSIFIMNMAIGDMIFLIIYVPTECSLLFSSQWNGGTPTCKLVYFVRYLTLGVSIFTLMALSTDRYFAIAYPLKQSNKRLRVVVVIGSVWFASASLAIPATFAARQRSIVFPPMNTTSCQVIRVCQVHVPGLPGFTDGLLWFKVFTYFLLPLVIIASFYGAMTVVLCRSSSFFDATSDSISGSATNGTCRVLAGTTPFASQQRANAMRRTANRKKLARTVLCLVAMFIICWLPINVYSIQYFVIKNVSMAFKTVAIQLTFIYSCVNPITLFVLSKRFRRAFRLYCCCGRGVGGQGMNQPGRSTSWADNYSRRVRNDWRYARQVTIGQSDMLQLDERDHNDT